jgi:sodium/bile acid cotransporter 7
MFAYFRRHWFLSLLAAVLIVGLVFGPRLAERLSEFPREWLLAMVMFLTALPMAFGQLAAAACAVRSVGLALGLSAVVAPPLAWMIGQTLPESFAIGLIVAASVPCTLVSAAVWTRRGGGNDAIALLVTLLTNLACFFVLPAWLWVLLRSEVEIDAGALSLRLLTYVVLPVVVAQLLRRSPTIAEAATTRKALLSYTAQLGVLTMVFFSAVSAGATLARVDSTTTNIGTWLGLLASVLGLHLALFAMGWFGGRLTGVQDGDRLAIAISGSQKTLMIGLDIAMGFGGLAVLPMIAYHVVQLIADTLLVDWLAEKSGSSLSQKVQKVSTHSADRVGQARGDE